MQRKRQLCKLTHSPYQGKEKCRGKKKREGMMADLNQREQRTVVLEELLRSMEE